MIQVFKLLKGFDYVAPNAFSICLPPILMNQALRISVIQEYDFSCMPMMLKSQDKEILKRGLTKLKSWADKKLKKSYF